MINLLRRDRAVYCVKLSRFTRRRAVLLGHHFVAITGAVHHEDPDGSAGWRNTLTFDQEIALPIPDRRNSHFLPWEVDRMTGHIEPGSILERQGRDCCSLRWLKERFDNLGPVRRKK